MISHMPKLSAGTRALLILNGLFFVVTYWVPNMRNRMVDWFALFFPMNDHFQMWQFISSLFMHGSVTHLFFNMFALFSFGMILEALWGTRKFIAFYFIVGIGAGLIYIGVNYFEFKGVYKELLELGFRPVEIQALLDTGYINPKIGSQIADGKLQEFYSHYNGPVLGASGAIYGILVAFGMMFPNAKLAFLFIPVPVAAKYIIPALLVFDLFSGVTGFSLFGGNIGHFAHIGGAIIGFLLMLYWKPNAKIGSSFISTSE
jgi:membrane associated rhomboid family serine protease